MGPNRQEMRVIQGSRLYAIRPPPAGWEYTEDRQQEVHDMAKGICGHFGGTYGISRTISRANEIARLRAWAMGIGGNRSAYSLVRRKGKQRTMNRRSWEQILKKYSESIGLEKEVIIVFKNTRDHVSGVIKEIDEDFLVLENKDGSGIAAIVELDEIAGFRTH